MSENLPEFDDDQKLEKQLKDAEARIERLSQDYEIWATEDLNCAKQALEVAKTMPSGRQMQVTKIFDIAHNMKGQGGTFGYDLVTMVSQSLCDFIRHIPDATDKELNVVDRHLSVITQILEQKIKGSGGSYAGKLIAKLNDMIAMSRDDLAS